MNVRYQLSSYHKTSITQLLLRQTKYKTLYLKYLAVELNVVLCNGTLRHVYRIVISDLFSDLFPYHSTLHCQTLINSLYSNHRLAILEGYVFCSDFKIDCFYQLITMSMVIFTKCTIY